MRALSLWQKGVVLGLWWAAAGPAPAAETNAYDLLGRVLRPFTALLAAGGEGPRALTLALRVEESHGYSMDLSGLTAEVTVEAPDKIRLRAPLFGQTYTLGRRGQTLWVYPGSKLRALLEQPAIAQRLPEPDRQYQLRPFQLPVPQKDLVFLPALFAAKSALAEKVNGLPCAVLDLKASPLFGKSAGLDAWSARLWVAAPAKPVRFTVTGPSTTLTGLVEKADFSATLPPETWVPAKAEEGDVVIVPPVRYDQLLRAMLGLK